MKRLQKTSSIDCQSLMAQFDLCKNELNRIMGNFTSALNNFENENNVTINNDCVPPNDSNNPFNMNCNFGKNFSNFANYCNIFFNKYKDNVKQQMDEESSNEEKIKKY